MGRKRKTEWDSIGRVITAVFVVLLIPYAFFTGVESAFDGLKSSSSQEEQLTADELEDRRLRAQLIQAGMSPNAENVATLKKFSRDLESLE